MALGEALWHRLGSLLGLTTTSYDAGLTIPVQGSDNKLYRITAGTLLAEVSADVVPYAVKDRSRTTAPTSPTNGDIHIVGANGGAWSSFTAGDIVELVDSAWTLRTAPAAGMLVYDEGAAENVQYRSGAWTPIDAVGSGTATYWTLPAIGGAVDGDSFADEGATIPIDFGIEVVDESTSLGTGIVTLKVAGAGVSAALTDTHEVTMTVGGGAAPPSYQYIEVGATTIDAGTTGATLTLTAGSGITLTPNGTTKDVTIASTATGATEAFKTIAVSGQSNVVADSATDTLTLAGTGVSITTDASTDTITITGAAASHTHNPALVLTDPLIARATSQTIADGAAATVDLDTEIYDPNSAYTLSSDGEITCTNAGTYISLCFLNARSAANNTHSSGILQAQDSSSGSFADIADSETRYHVSSRSVTTNTGKHINSFGYHVLDAGEKIRFRCTPVSGDADTEIMPASRVFVFRLATTGN